MIPIVAEDVPGPFIRRLTIDRFRGIKHLVWYPERGANVILGAGDVGKSTVLEAVALLLHPTNTTVLSDADYFGRQVEAGFEIEAVMSLPDESGIHDLTKHAWPWDWDGKDPLMPSSDGSSPAIPVYRICVRGSAEYELLYELVQPDDSKDHLSVGIRQRIGLVRLGGDDRNDRDLRLVQGSALDRLLADRTLRSRLGHTLGDEDIKSELSHAAKEKLTELDEAFKKQALPHGLGLGLMGGPGISLNSLVGLTAMKHGVRLPLASWGAGTRRLASLEVAAVNQGRHPITLVDEAERGLEPYRQRALIEDLQNNESQVFVTSHSAAALRAVTKASVWRADSPGSLVSLPRDLKWLLANDPEALLAKLPIIAEGVTEKGFVTALLRRAIEFDLLDCGVWITVGGGVTHTLTLLEGAVQAKLKMGGFADREGPNQTNWSAVEAALGKVVFRWPNGLMEQYLAELLADESVPAFIADSDGDSGSRLRTLADRLGSQDASYESIKSKAGDDFKRLIGQTAAGHAPEDMTPQQRKIWRGHAASWFKSIEGGEELLEKVFRLDLWPKLKPVLLPFVNAVRTSVELSEISDIK